MDAAGGHSHPGRHPTASPGTSSRASPTWAPTAESTVAILLGLGSHPPVQDAGELTVDCVVTNMTTTPIAGRPEAIYYLERIIDAYAREIDGPDRGARRTWQPEEFPVTLGCGLPSTRRSRRRHAEAQGDRRLRGPEAPTRRGAPEGAWSAFVGPRGGGFGPPFWRTSGSPGPPILPSSFNGSGLVRVNPDGTATVIIGTGPSGQGHQTAWHRSSDGLGIPLDDIRVHHGDSATSPMGIGTFGSRSLAVDGTATFAATEAVREKAAKIAAKLLEAAPEDIVFADGGAHVAGSPDRGVDWKAIAQAAYQGHTLPEGVDSGLEETIIHTPGNATWPFGTHLAMVEVDPDTGDVELLEYYAVDDCGNQVNPMIVNGQVHGGIAQGVGQALFEDAYYDQDGNPSRALVDYPIPLRPTCCRSSSRTW